MRDDGEKRKDAKKERNLGMSVYSTVPAMLVLPAYQPFHHNSQPILPMIPIVNCVRSYISPPIPSRNISAKFSSCNSTRGHMACLGKILEIGGCQDN